MRGYPEYAFKSPGGIVECVEFLSAAYQCWRIHDVLLLLVSLSELRDDCAMAPGQDGIGKSQVG